MYIKRLIEDEIAFSLEQMPVTAIIGPRQCGKSTLARHMVSRYTKAVYLDLERPGDLSRLDDAQLFFESVDAELICIDEVQRKPDLFPLIRSMVDEWDRPGCFLLLGSASRDMLRQSSESLAGRISYKRLTPFLASELADADRFALSTYAERGGFPRSILASSNRASRQWRDDFILTFLERDLVQWRSFTPATMGRLWRMLAHVNGQTVNYSRLASSLDVSNATVKTYIDLLASTFMVELVAPWHSNLGKRLVKSPKVYLADSGLTAALLGLMSYGDILGHPASGAIWEQIVLSQIRGWFPQAEICFYRSAAGSEVDFVVRLGRRVFAIECKLSVSPRLSKGNHLAFADIQPDHAYVVIPTESGWPLTPDIHALSLTELHTALATSA